MANIPGAKVKMNDIEIAQEAALSEAVHTKIGANINALIDDDVSLQNQINTNAGNISTNASNITILQNRQQILESGPNSTSISGSGSYVTFLTHTFNFSGTEAIGFLLNCFGGSVTINDSIATPSQLRILLNGVTVWEIPTQNANSTRTFSFIAPRDMFTTTHVQAATNSVTLEFQGRGTSGSLTAFNARLAKISF